ncbi:hypothetical protein QTN25_009432 [Entamoeba marina]
MDKNTKRLDSYSMLIVSKYLSTKRDYINIICVCKKFKETTEKLRFNPIPITSLKLFPKIQTQYLYSPKDKMIDGVMLYEIRYEIDFKKYLQFKKRKIKCRRVKYTETNREEYKKNYGNSIPDGVTSLGDKCYEMSDIKNLTIPNNVTSIGNYCFDWCSDLESITLPTSLTTIPSFCFYYCESLTSINIPQSIKTIGEYCFQYCTSLQTIIIPNSVTSIQEACFSKCTSLQSIKLPSTIITLEDETFNECLSLGRVELPPTLTSIGNQCFSSCKSLTTITLPSSLKSIGKRCFYDGDLVEICVPNQVEFIGVECFSECTYLSKLQLPVNKYNECSIAVTFSDSMYYQQYGINFINVVLTQQDVTLQIDKMEQHQQKIVDEFVILDGIVGIEDNAFSNRKHLENIYIPTTVTSIGNNCFNGCSGLTSLVIPNTVQSIGINCFVGCDNLIQLSVPLNENNQYPFKVSHDDYFILIKRGISCVSDVISEKDHHKHSFQ